MQIGAIQTQSFILLFCSLLRGEGSGFLMRSKVGNYAEMSEKIVVGEGGLMDSRVGTIVVMVKLS